MQVSRRPSDDCAGEVLEAVPAVIWFIRREMRSHRQGLSIPQFRAMALVDRQPAASLSAVAELLGASLPTASRIVSGLVRRGLIRRQECAVDRRQVSLAVTERGRAVLRQARSATRLRLAEQLRRLNPRGRRDVLTAMRTLRRLFGPVGQVNANGS